MKGPAKSVQEASKTLLSAVFVRHPFHRLVSAYNDKIARRNTRFFPPIRKYIVENYRNAKDLMKSYISKYEWQRDITHCRIGFSEETHANCAKIPTNTGPSLIQETKNFQRKF